VGSGSGTTRATTTTTSAAAGTTTTSTSSTTSAAATTPPVPVGHRPGRSPRRAGATGPAGRGRRSWQDDRARRALDRGAPRCCLKGPGNWIHSADEG
jgi:hypothetical protein